jgi:hypothetical protein
VVVVVALEVVEQAHLTVVKTIEVAIEEIKLQVVQEEQQIYSVDHYTLLVAEVAADI